MTTVSSILTSVSYDLKLTTSELSTRTNELISYMNRIINTEISPVLIRFKSDMGMKAWTTQETTAYVPEYTLPSDFISFYSLYAKEADHTGALADATSTSVVLLDSDASDEDDYYNGMVFRMTSGDEDGEQVYVTDYAGATRQATLSPVLSGTPTAAETFAIFNRVGSEDELTQVELWELNSEYSGMGDVVYVYALSVNTKLILGPTPYDSDIILEGMYFYTPTALSASTDSLPYNGIFDELIRSYTSQLALLRDEYDIRVENSIHNRIESEVLGIIKSRMVKRPVAGQSKIKGS